MMGNHKVSEANEGRERLVTDAGLSRSTSNENVLTSKIGHRVVQVRGS
jgi:hypothetical protein